MSLSTVVIMNHVYMSCVNIIKSDYFISFGIRLVMAAHMVKIESACFKSVICIVCLTI